MVKSFQEKLTALRALMDKEAIDVLLVPRTDEYQSEYVAPYAERLKFLTGFTGSAGMGVIKKQNAFLFTDGRYTEQAKGQCDASLYKVKDITANDLGDFLAQQSGTESSTVGYDPWLHTPEQIKKFEDKGAQLKALSHNLIDQIWSDQPKPSSTAISHFPEEVAGRSAQEKIELVSKMIKEGGADAYLLTQPASICWLLNIRGQDVEHTPLVMTYALVKEGKAERIKRTHDLSTLENQTVALDFKRTPKQFMTILKEVGAKVKNMEDPCLKPRALKTASEQEAICAAHIKDAVALVKFLHWFEQRTEDVTELDVVERLETFRREDPAYKGASFPTIAGFNPNGAIIHYRATPETNLEIKGDGLLLIDSGGQYEWGTTDITRTIPVGMPSEEMKENFTLVLKGYIALAMTRFEKGTTGKTLDQIARQPLLDKGRNYAHSTGHGVGCYLSVHEEAANISPKGEDALEAGMLLSNEPGYYEAGAYGIRTENLMFVQEAQNNELGFETISLLPVETSLIMPGILSAEETQWLNQYHAEVYEAVSPHLSEALQEWLQGKTKAV